MIRRPALRYYGGKWRLAPWILAHMPPHRCYVEPYCGGASVLIRKMRAPAETINDLDGHVVGFFRVLRERPDDLIRAIRYTPFSRAEFEDARRLEAEDDLELARLVYIKSWQAMHAGLRPNRTGWRHCRGTGRLTSAADEFADVDHLYGVAERLRGVQIECDEALAVIGRYDSADTVHLVDPPYLAETRSHRWGRDGYQHEMAEQDHRELLEVLRQVNGSVLLCAYRNPLYDQLIDSAWERRDREVVTMKAGKATESLYLNPAAIELQRQQQLPWEGAV